MRRASCLLLCLAGSLAAAQTGPAPSLGPAGVTPVWDVRANMAELAADIAKLAPLLGQVNPGEWVAKGAPEAYIRQVQACQANMQALVDAAAKLAQDPEKLSTALETFFQMERMELLVSSLQDGIRRYQSADLADTLSRAFAENVVHRDRLRNHIKDLAKVREQEFEIVNQEAQRCRGLISRQAPAEKKVEPRKRK